MGEDFHSIKNRQETISLLDITVLKSEQHELLVKIKLEL